jgi:peptidoglycan hydrolase CwlO-like protein
MPSQLENTNTNQQIWTEQEIKELILYAKDLQQQVDDKSAQLIMMNSKLQNEEKKVTRLTNILKALNIWQ